MDFRNHTPFPALAFEGIDQLDQAFHVVVLRQTLTWDGDGALVYAEEQEPLCEVDQYFGAMNASSVRQESDLCHYKPKCDVIVNATAHAPQGTPARHCPVRLVLRRPDTAAPLPARPQGLNQFVEPDAQRLAEWRAETALAGQRAIPGERLIDKSLTVTGERELVRAGWPVRLLASALRLATAGWFKGGQWRLGAPKPFTSLPLRYEYAYGGECRVDHGDPRARRIPRKHRLAEEQSAALAGADQTRRPIALRAFEANAVGRGYAQPWHLRATGARRVPAPRIEAADRPFTVAAFRQQWNDAAAQDGAAMAAGLGARARVHPARRALGGTVDQDFARSGAWLPPDFDFAVWNAAPPDQQTAFLRGDEHIELTNLCEPGSPGATVNGAGDTCLALRLPGHSCTLLMRMRNGTMFFHPMRIDTVIVEPAGRKVSLVWRSVFGKTPEIRAVDVSLHKDFEAEFTRQLAAELDKTPLDGLLSAAQPEVSHG